MNSFQVALLQMTAMGCDATANLEKGDAFCRRAQALGADIALFPEMWNVGYTPCDEKQPEARAAWEAKAIDHDDSWLQHFQTLARELKMAIAVTYLEAWPEAPRNTVSIFDRHGNLVLTYAKVHTCDFGFECTTAPGDDFYVCDLDTVRGTVKIGAMICYDREFPESARILALKGAEIILTPNACNLGRARIEQFRTRAFENMVGVAMTNYAAPKNNGHSVAFDGIVFHEIDAGERDMMLVEANENEGVYLADFDLDELRVYREQGIWGNAYRKPGRYQLLTSPEVQAPFLRADARRL